MEGIQTSFLNIDVILPFVYLSVNYFLYRIVVNYGILVKMKADNWWYFISPFQRDVWLVLIVTVLFSGTKFKLNLSKSKDKIMHCIYQPARNTLKAFNFFKFWILDYSNHSFL